MLLTNKFIPEYNYENIDRDFDIFKITKESKDFYNTRILDIPSADFNARAVQYLYGASFFVLFGKDSVKESEFRSTLQDLYEDVTVKRINILDEKDRKGFCEGDSCFLANLLINSMKSPKNKNLTYNNLTGSLYYRDSEWINKTKQYEYIWFLKVYFSSGMYLHLDVQTFKKTEKADKETRYIFDPKTGAFRKKLKFDIADSFYIKRSYKNKHNTVEFLKYGDFRSFTQSKMGVMEQFLRDVQTLLEKYVVFNPESNDNFTDYTKSSFTDFTAKDIELEKAFRTSGVNIADCCKTEASEKTVLQIKDEFEKLYKIKACTGELNHEMFNIRVIHNKEFYENKKELCDPHKEDLSGYVVQHVTLEDFSDKNASINKYAFDNIIRELIIKKDNRCGRMTIYDWSKLNFKDVRTFVMRKKEQSNKDEKDDSEVYVYYMMKINPDGSFVFENFKDSDNELSEEQEHIISSFEFFQMKAKRFKQSVEGLMYKDFINVNAIVRTREFTRPNTSFIYDALRETEPSESIDKSKLISYVCEFYSQNSRYENYASELLEKLEQANACITKGELKAMMNMRCSAAKALNRWLKDKYGFWVYSEIKSLEDDPNNLNMSNMVNIKYSREENYGEESLRYFVGAKSLNGYSVDKSCVVRKIIAESEVLPPEEIFGFMAVEFVRHNQYTVIPFPFKYLREYNGLDYGV
ncbi:MAG: hypothetical protein II931_04425 [Clostridia bacterium]|nr:hypothetical protein [Clostridia bacterium]